MAALLALAACTTASPSAAPSVEPSSSEAVSACPAPGTAPGADGLPPTGQVVSSEPVALRSAPGSGEDSTTLGNELWPGTRFGILEGPIEASGSRWYRVQVGELSGWAAAGSADGDPWLAAVRNGSIGFGGQPAGEETPQLFLVNPDGTGVCQLTQLTAADIALAAPAGTVNPPDAMRPALTCGFGLSASWSPSGDRIALNVGGCDTVILTVAADGTGMVRIGDGRQPAWSNDGAWLAFGLNVPYLPCGQACGGPELGPWEIQVAPATGGDPTAVSHGAAWEAATGPIWSPSGLELAFNCGPIDGATSVCMVEADGSNQRIVAAAGVAAGAPGGIRLVARSTTPGGARLLSWSPDGTRLVVQRGDGTEATELWLARADGSGEVMLPGLGNAFPAAWSPDGQQIALTVFDPISARERTILVASDGSASRELAAGSRFQAWAPDGQSILVSSIGAGDATRLSLVDLASDAILPIVDLPPELIGGSYGFAWQPLLEYSLH